MHTHTQVMAGPNLPSLRTQYMDLVGHSPVPQKKLFGLWQCIFGYHDWADVEDDVKSLTQPTNSWWRFPIDGVGFDIYWFGGGFYGDDKEEVAIKNSKMGSLSWDLSHFPDPKAHIQVRESVCVCACACVCVCVECYT